MCSHSKRCFSPSHSIKYVPVSRFSQRHYPESFQPANRAVLAPRDKPLGLFMTSEFTRIHRGLSWHTAKCRVAGFSECLMVLGEDINVGNDWWYVYKTTLGIRKWFRSARKNGVKNAPVCITSFGCAPIRCVPCEGYYLFTIVRIVCSLWLRSLWLCSLYLLRLCSYPVRSL